VSLSSLKTRSSHIPLLLPGAKAPDAVMDDVTLIHPPSEEDAEEPSATLHDDDDLLGVGHCFAWHVTRPFVDAAG